MMMLPDGYIKDTSTIPFGYELSDISYLKPIQNN